MRVRACFFDYDGTLAPLNVPREESRIHEPLASTLRMIQRSIPVAIVTAKDYRFVHRRTLFADAWSCAYGMETVLRNGTGKTLKPAEDISGAIRIVKTMPNPPQLEYKRTTAGETCGFCAEWEPGRGPGEEAIREAVAKIRGLGMQVFGNNRPPAFDVIPGSGDKGVAVEMLREMLHVPDGLMYIGDSDTDIPAFKVSDMGIGIVGNGDKSDLKCDYYLKRRALNRFLLSLSQGGFEFSENLPGLFRNGGRA